MKNMKISKRLMLGFGVVLVFLVIIAAIGIGALLIVENDYSYLLEYPVERLDTLSSIELEFQSVRRATANMSMYADIAGQSGMITGLNSDIDQYFNNIDGLMSRYEQLLRDDSKYTDEVKQARLNDSANIRRLAAAYRADIVNPAYQANQAGNRQQVINIFTDTENLAVVGDLFDLVGSLQEMASAAVHDLEESTTALALGAQILLIIAALLAVAVSVVFAVMIAKGVISSLTESVSKMTEVTHTVSSSSRQLDASSRSLADGAQAQAASIEETSATMNETSSMIRQTKENTQQAARLSGESEKSALESLTNVENLMNVMNKLSESSSQIEKIADTINSIASQTNILALNASVEAVRVGEAGRGFAVVAEEVRSLATQSADAARNTAEIIKENIELAIQGVENSRTVSTAINGVHQDVRQINMLLAEISTASEEQSRGVDQIALAINQMEQATQSNAAVSEESSAAANALLSSSEDLAEVTDNLNAMI